MKTILIFAVFAALTLIVASIFGLFWPTLLTIVALVVACYFAVNATPSPYPHEGSNKQT